MVLAEPMASAYADTHDDQRAANPGANPLRTAMRVMREKQPKVRSQEDVTLVAHSIGTVGGMERQLAELALGLREHGHRVTVVARTCELPPGSGVSFHRVRGPKRPFLIAYPWFMVAGSFAVRRWRRGIVQSTGAIVLNRGVDVVAVHFCHQVGKATPSRPTITFRCYVRIVGFVKRIAERLCFRVNSPAAFVCVSDGVAGEMREHYPKMAKRIMTIHNGVDTDRFAPGVCKRESCALRTKLGVDAEKFLAAFVGGEWDRKGLRVLLEALARAPRWELVVVGRGDQRRYRRIAQSIGVGDAVHWLGVMRDIQVVYQMSDAFCLPSSYETFSLVTFEAASSALPIVATPVSGVRDLIQDEESGFLVNAQPGAIAERLTQLAEDSGLRERLGREARRSALRFQWDVMVAAHRRLYASLASSREARCPA